MRKLIPAGCLLVVCMTALIDAHYPVVIDPFVGQATLTASDSEALDEFGTSVAVSGDTIVAGSPRGNGVTGNTGAAYVFEKPAGGWNGTLVEHAKLVASDGTLNASFGASVAFSGDTIVIGTRVGAAYLFEKPSGGWTGTLTETAKLIPSECCSSNLTVAISGDTVVAGSPNKSYAGSTLQGAAYLFVKPASGWAGTLTESARLLASDGAGGDSFGTAVAMSGNVVVLGASQDEPGAGGAGNQGSAYVFVTPAGGWSGTLNESARLIASDAASGDLLGASVALSGSTVVIGAPRRGAADQGGAYVFETPAGGWTGTLTEDATLIGSDGGGQFGIAVGASGNTIVAGAFVDSVTNGKAYVYVEPLAGWSGTLSEDQLIPSGIPGLIGARFGAAVSMSGGTIVVAAPRAGPNNDQGAAFVFIGPEADLALSKTAAPDPVLAGGDLTYTIAVTNQGPDDASAVTVTDILPAEVTFVSCTATGGGSCGGSGNSRSVAFSSLAAGASESISIVASVNAGTAGGTTIGNTASVASATSDPDPANDSATATATVVNQADLAVTKTASAATVETGTNVSYIVTVANNGPNAAGNVTLADTLPAGTTFVSRSSPSGSTCFDPTVGALGTITCSSASLAGGVTATFTVVANVGCGLATGTVLNGSASVGSDTPDPSPDNNVSDASVTVSNPPPAVSAAVATSVLAFRTNPELRNVGLSATVSDGACSPPAVSSVEVFGDEDDEAPIARSRVHSPDAADIGIGTLRLRAERVRSLDGRVYLIVVKAADAAGAVGFATTTVVVPRRSSQRSIASVNAQAAAARSFADGHGGSPPAAFFVIGDGALIGPLQ